MKRSGRQIGSTAIAFDAGLSLLLAIMPLGTLTVYFASATVGTIQGLILHQTERTRVLYHRDRAIQNGWAYIAFLMLLAAVTVYLWQWLSPHLVPPILLGVANRAFYCFCIMRFFSAAIAWPWN